jgi:hypothetical protein
VPELLGIYRDECELPQLETELKEDLLDELELLGFTVADPFELLDLAHSGYLPTRGK